jgi:hypothetical protein
MAKKNPPAEAGARGVLVSPPLNVLETLPLWQLDIVELTGHNIEAHGREEVNRLLGAGWRLLHIYTLKFQEHGEWRERPMAILGKPRSAEKQKSSAEGGKSAELFKQDTPRQPDCSRA